MEEKNNKINKKSIFVGLLITLLVIVIIVLLVLLINEKNSKSENSTNDNDSGEVENNEEHKIENNIDFVACIDNQLVAFDKDLNSKVLVPSFGSWSSGFDIYDDTLYYVKDGFVHSMYLDGTNDKKLEIPVEDNYISMRVTEKYITFLKNDSNSIAINKKTKERIEIDASTNNYGNFKYKNKLIFMEPDGSSISSFDLDKMEKSVIGQGDVRTVSLTNKYLVYVDESKDRVYVYDLDDDKMLGDVKLDVDVYNINQLDVIVDNNKLYTISNNYLIEYDLISKKISNLHQFEKYDETNDYLFFTRDNNIIILRELLKIAGYSDVVDFESIGTEIVKYDINTKKADFIKSEALEKYSYNPVVYAR